MCRKYNRQLYIFVFMSNGYFLRIRKNEVLDSRDLILFPLG